MSFVVMSLVRRLSKVERRPERPQITESRQAMARRPFKITRC
jgi:hypothetical protein